MLMTGRASRAAPNPPALGGGQARLAQALNCRSRHPICCSRRCWCCSFTVVYPLINDLAELLGHQGWEAAFYGFGNFITLATETSAGGLRRCCGRSHHGCSVAPVGSSLYFARWREATLIPRFDLCGVRRVGGGDRTSGRLSADAGELLNSLLTASASAIRPSGWAMPPPSGA